MPSPRERPIAFDPPPALCSTAELLAWAHVLCCAVCLVGMLVLLESPARWGFCALALLATAYTVHRDGWWPRDLALGGGAVALALAGVGWLALLVIPTLRTVLRRRLTVALALAPTMLVSVLLVVVVLSYFRSAYDSMGFFAMPVATRLLLEGSRALATSPVAILIATALAVGLHDLLHETGEVGTGAALSVTLALLMGVGVLVAMFLPFYRMFGMF